MSTETRKMDPSQPIAAYNARLPKLEKMRHVLGGTDAMREAALSGGKYLPQYDGEGDDNYKARVNRSTFTNFTARTLDNFAGRVFRKAITTEDESIPESIADLLENVDLIGNNLNAFGRRLFKAGMTFGDAYILVDNMGTALDEEGNPVQLTIEQEREAGIRPYFVLVKPETIIGWRTEYRQGKEVLTQLRIKEDAVEPDGDFGEKKVERIRVLYEDRFEVWVFTDKGDGTHAKEWQVVNEGPMSIGKIPLVAFAPGSTGGMMKAKPPLEDLADKNIEHWVSASDQRNCLCMARFSMLACTGVETGEKPDSESEKSDVPETLGPFTVLVSEKAEAKYYMVEPSGAALQSGKEDLEALKEEMAKLGLSFLTQKPGNRTATSDTIDEGQEISDLQRAALELRECLVQALSLMAEWRTRGTETKTPNVTVNTDVGLTAEQKEIVSNLLDMRKQGADGKPDISRRTLHAELKRRSILSPTFDHDDEVAQIVKEFEDAGMPGFTNEQ